VKFLAFLEAVETISHYCLLGQNSYTDRLFPDTDVYVSESPISNTALKIIILNLITALSGNTSYYVITIVLLTQPIYDKLQNAK